MEGRLEGHLARFSAALEGVEWFFGVSLHVHVRGRAHARTWITLKYPSNPSKWSERTDTQQQKRRKSASIEDGKMEGQGLDMGFQLEGRTLPDDFMTWDMVQDRLIEAVLLLWRLPDREKGWQRVRANWPDVLRHNWFGDYGDAEAEPTIPPATRAELAEMEEALSWMRHVRDEDRRLVALVIRQLARGARDIRWRQLLKPMGLVRGADGLRMRYSRAINGVAVAINATDRSGR